MYLTYKQRENGSGVFYRLTDGVSAEERSTRDQHRSLCSSRLPAAAARGSLTSLGREVQVFIDGTEEVLLLAAEFPGSEDVPDALMEVRVLALRRRSSRQQGQDEAKGKESGGVSPPKRFPHLRLHHV